MHLEFHHQNKVLFARRIGGASSSLSCALYGIEDVRGDVTFLSLQCFSTPDDSILERGEIVAIKEPYFAIDALENFRQIFVAHPSDIMTLDEEDSRLPLQFRKKLDLSRRSALQLKVDGNHKIKAKCPADSVKLYTKALCLEKDLNTRLRSDLLRNRAQAYLDLQRFEVANDDALASILDAEDAGDDRGSMKQLNAKAYYRAGCAAYGLRQFDEAKRLFTESSRLSPGDKQTSDQLRRTITRQLERDQGRYDFDNIVNYMASQRQYVIDAADFTKKVRIQQTATRGRGLFATEDIHCGDIILCEKAVHVARAGDPGVFPTVKLHAVKDTWKREDASCGYKGLIRKLSANPSLIPSITSLHAGSTSTSAATQSAAVVDGQPVIDAYQIHEIFATNTFALPPYDNISNNAYPLCATDGTGGHGSGLWYTISHINHDCISNAQIAFLGDLAILRARRDIAAGEEISLIYYCPENLEERQKTLKESWGFECDCSLCTAEALIPTENRERREHLLDELNKLAHTGGDLTAMKRTIKDLDATYDERIHANLPRMALAEAYEMLADVLYKRGHPVTELHQTLELALKAYGIVLHFDPKSEGYRVEPQRWVLNAKTVGLLVHMKQCAEASQMEAMTAEIEKVARLFYRVLNGLETGFEFVGRD